MLRSRSFDLTVANRILEEGSKKVQLRASVGDDLQALARDRAIVTDPEETRRRRTIRLSRIHLRASWGFTLQTYGIRNKRTGEVEVMSYVDYVEMNSPAWVAGMMKGDVILSVNGESVESCTHSDLVTRIQRGGRDLRLVVLFEDCCKKVELQERYIKLKKMLSLKLKELRRLEGEESRLLKGSLSLHLANGERENLASTPTLLSRLSALRQSNMSRSSVYSSTSSDWDAYSEITSPLDNVPVNQFAFGGSMSDVSVLSSRGSAPEMSGHAREASISGSSGSGSQSELPSDTESANRVRRLSEGSDQRGAATAARRSTLVAATGDYGDGGGQVDGYAVSELESSGGFGRHSSCDGDTDSQTSFFSLAGSSPKVSTLSDMLTRDELSKAHGDVSDSEENFRQMYTVARWVGVVGHQNTNTGIYQGGPGFPRNKRVSSGGLEDRREVARARSLSSVNEVGEEGTGNDDGEVFEVIDELGGEEGAGVLQPTPEFAEPVEARSSRSVSTSTVASKQSFYLDSDSEGSSASGTEGNRGRRGTVINTAGAFKNSYSSQGDGSICEDEESDSARRNDSAAVECDAQNADLHLEDSLSSYKPSSVSENGNEVSVKNGLDTKIPNVNLSLNDEAPSLKTFHETKKSVGKVTPSFEHVAQPDSSPCSKPELSYKSGVLVNTDSVVTRL